MAQHDGLNRSLDAFEEGAQGKLEAGVRDEVRDRFYKAYDRLTKAQWDALEPAVLEASRTAGGIALSLADLNGAAQVSKAHALAALRAVRDICTIDLPERRAVCIGVDLDRAEPRT